VKYVEKEYRNRIGKYDNVKQCLKDIKSDLEIVLQKSLDRLPLIVPMFVYMNSDGEMIEDSVEVVE
jgi:hypothetical protein